MDTLEELKEDIARKADKEKYEAGKLKAKDDLNAVPEVFLSVTGGKGKTLRLSLDTFKEDALSLIKNDAHRQLVGTYLNTESPGTGISWEKETFSYLPAIGGVTFINKMQEEVLLCVNEVYRSLLYEEAEDGKGGAFVFINEDQMIVVTTTWCSFIRLCRSPPKRRRRGVRSAWAEWSKKAPLSACPTV